MNQENNKTGKNMTKMPQTSLLFNTIFANQTSMTSNIHLQK